MRRDGGDDGGKRFAWASSERLSDVARGDLRCPARRTTRRLRVCAGGRTEGQESRNSVPRSSLESTSDPGMLHWPKERCWPSPCRRSRRPVLLLQPTPSPGVLDCFSSRPAVMVGARVSSRRNRRPGVESDAEGIADGCVDVERVDCVRGAGDVGAGRAGGGSAVYLCPRHRRTSWCRARRAVERQLESASRGTRGVRVTCSGSQAHSTWPCR